MEILRAFLFTYDMSGRVKLGISSCLLGSNVRYDGGNKLDLYLRQAFDPFVEWVPVCPEVEAGLLIPREPMQLVAGTESLRLIAIVSGADQTERLLRWIDEKVRWLEDVGLCGFVLKARSPSCGIRDAAIVKPSGGTAQGPGLFAAVVMRMFPSLPVEDEGRLRDPAVRENFIRRITGQPRH